MRGKQRLARWLIGGSRALQAELTLVTRAGQRLTAPNGLDPIAFSLLISGEYEPEVLESGALDFIAFEFLDWAEQRVPGHRPGDAQRFLLEMGFTLWELEDYRHGRPPLDRVLETGGCMLVAARQ